nr:hypothetical protein [uncultured Acidovorax sp.]
MSAFVVSTAHIDAILTFVYCTPRDGGVFLGQPGPGVEVIEAKSTSGLTKLGGLLMNTNIESVNTRYRLDDLEPPYQFTLHKGFVLLSLPVAALRTIKLCHCLEYQSCELDEWHQLPAKAVIQQIVGRASRHLAGYDDAPWAID